MLAPEFQRGGCLAATGALCADGRSHFVWVQVKPGEGFALDAGATTHTPCTLMPRRGATSDPDGWRAHWRVLSLLLAAKNVGHAFVMDTEQLILRNFSQVGTVRNARPSVHLLFVSGRSDACRACVFSCMCCRVCVQNLPNPTERSLQAQANSLNQCLAA